MTWDTVLVGAGAAGCVLAARLAEDPGHRVLLLEAGPDFASIDDLPDEIRRAYGKAGLWGRAFGYQTRFGWGYRARASASHPDMFVPRGRLVGGSSAVNAQIFLRGLPEDYDGWARAGNPAWAWEHVLPCLKRIEADRDFGDDFHGTDGPIPVRRVPRDECTAEHVAFETALRERGMPACPDHNDPNSTGVGPLPLNNADGVRWSAALGYLTPEVRARPNLTIRGGVTTWRVVVEDGRATAVHVDGPEGRIAAGQIVLCAGAIASPQLLMLSGIGPAARLEALDLPVHADLPGVGANLRCHGQCPLLVEARPVHRNTGAEPPLQMGCRYTASGSELRNDMFLHPGSCASRSGYYDADDTGMFGFILVAAIYLAAGAGSVRLRSADPRQPPLLDYGLLAEASDLVRMREGVRILLDLLEHDAYVEIARGPVNLAAADAATDDALDAWMRRWVATSHHVSGTCRMGPDDDAMAVVDQSGRVRGVDGLRVADASIMHDCIRANTNLTTMMIGERVAELMEAAT